MKRRISFLGGKIRLRSSEGIRACHDTLYIYNLQTPYMYMHI